MTKHTTGTPSPLWKWLNSIEPVKNHLAWCHTTDAFRLRKMIVDKFFEPSHCKVFDEDLSYFFYGRPAFRRRDQEQTRLSSRTPIAIILHPSLVDMGCRMYPFDSGAFTGHYKQWMHPEMKLSDFELICSPDAPKKSIAAFFGNNVNYLRATSTAPPKPYDGEFEVESVVELLRDPSSHDADDRRLAIELQVGKKIDFDSKAILALIAPDELEEAIWFQEFMNGPGRGIIVSTYKTMLLRRIGEYQALLEEHALEIQESRGMT